LTDPVPTCSTCGPLSAQHGDCRLGRIMRRPFRNVHRAPLESYRQGRIVDFKARQRDYRRSPRSLKVTYTEEVFFRTTSQSEHLSSASR
jgi:hypothetical protein